MQVPAMLGIWPFDSEAAANLDKSITASAALLKASANDSLSLGQKADFVTASLLASDSWVYFIQSYMAVARQLGKSYTSNTDFYTQWSPLLQTYGYNQDTLEVVMAALRGLINTGSIPPEVADPQHTAPPGSPDSPIGSLFTGIGKSIQGTVLGLGVIATLGLMGYKILTRPGR